MPISGRLRELALLFGPLDERSRSRADHGDERPTLPLGERTVKLDHLLEVAVARDGMRPVLRRRGRCGHEAAEAEGLPDLVVEQGGIERAQRTRADEMH